MVERREGKGKIKNAMGLMNLLQYKYLSPVLMAFGSQQLGLSQLRHVATSCPCYRLVQPAWWRRWALLPDSQLLLSKSQGDTGITPQFIHPVHLAVL